MIEIVSEALGASPPVIPECLAPEIKYDGESDTLWIGNGRASPNGMDLFDGCVVFFDTERRVSGVMLEDAGELLLPLLGGANAQLSKHHPAG